MTAQALPADDPPLPADEPASADDSVKDEVSALLRLRAAARAERTRRNRRNSPLRLYAVRAQAERID